MQQSAILLAMNYVANNKEKFLNNFYLKSKRSVAKATTEGRPRTFCRPSETRPAEQAELVESLEIAGLSRYSDSDTDVETKDGKFGAGSYVVRMDQPYSRMADMLLDTQYYNVNDPRPYDDTGWTLGPLHNVKTVRVKDDGDPRRTDGADRNRADQGHRERSKAAGVPRSSSITRRERRLPSFGID